MRRFPLILLLLLFLVMVQLSASQHRLLRVLKPAGNYVGRYDVIIHKKDIEAILKDPALDFSGVKTQVRIYDPGGAKVAKLAIVNKGRIKWLFRSLPGDVLGVKIDSTQARQLLDEACKKNKETGYQLVLTREEKRSDKLVVLKCYPLVFSHHVDLHGVLVYPLQVAPGDSIEKKIVLTVFNEGTASARNFYVQLLLAEDPDQSPQGSLKSGHLSKNLALINGRLRVDVVPPGDSVNVLFNGPLRVPSDITPGRYRLVALLDSENSIQEVRENNNFVSRVMIISQEASDFLPKPNEAPVDLRKLIENKRGRSQRKKH